MPKIRPDEIYIGPTAIESLIQYCRRVNHGRLLMVADRNTYAALGQRVEDALRNASFDLKTVLLTSDEVVADAHNILQILIAANNEGRTFLAVGSGTITDLTRFTSHRTGVPFIAMPTAPSVDGFTSIGAPTIVRGVKKTLVSQPPAAIFVDIETLAGAPQRLLAAGFGDMMGKFTSAADFRLGRLLWDEPYDEEIADRTRMPRSFA
ncbi:MAG: iron-containing alcohol dehydrogenase [Caldilineaceae bacterium]